MLLDDLTADELGVPHSLSATTDKILYTDMYIPPNFAAPPLAFPLLVTNVSHGRLMYMYAYGCHI